MSTLSNTRICMEFDDAGRLARLESADGAVKAPIDAASLTEAFVVVLRSAAGEITVVRPEGRPAVEPIPHGLVFRWRVEGPWGRLDAAGRVVLPPDSACAEWTFELDNRTDRSLWELTYPRISGLRGYDGADGGELIAPRGSGQLIPNPVAAVNGPERAIGDWELTEYGHYNVEGGAHIAFSYPGLWALQCMAYGQGARGGVYFAAHDGQALYKRFGLYRDGGDGRHAALLMKQYPRDRLEPGERFASFYPVTVGVYAGPWWAASALYRQWAMRQVWCRKGPTKDRADISEKSKQLDIWYWNYTFGTDSRPRKIVPVLRFLRETLGCNLGFHWYSFNGEMFARWRIPWGAPDNPDILDVLVRGVREMHALGVLVIPYLDCRLWGEETRSFKAADGMKWIVRDEKGEGCTWPTTSAWTMCPTAAPFHDLTSRLVAEVMEKCELDGAYLDQVTCCNAVPCFNRDHDHPPGGHDHWVRGYRALAERIQREIKARSPDAIITSEGYIECFLDLFDLDLGYALNHLWVGHYPGVQPIPLYQSVYHDYHMTYGTMNKFTEPNLALFRYRDALLLAGGGQLGICGAFAGIEKSAAHRPMLDYVGTLVRARMAGRRWFNLGVWKPPLSLACERVTLDLSDAKKQGRLEAPAVRSGCFEVDGELCVALVNHTAREQSVSFDMAPAAYGLAGSAFELESIHPGSPRRLARLGAEGARQSLALGPASAQVLVVRPAHPGPANSGAHGRGRRARSPGSNRSNIHETT